MPSFSKPGWWAFRLKSSWDAYSPDPSCAGVRKQDRKPPSPAHGLGRAAGADGRATHTPRRSPTQAGGASPCPSCTSCLKRAPHLQARGPPFHSEPFLSGPLPGESAFLPQAAGFFSTMDQSQDKLKRFSAQGNTVHSNTVGPTRITLNSPAALLKSVERSN